MYHPTDEKFCLEISHNLAHQQDYHTIVENMLNILSIIEYVE